MLGALQIAAICLVMDSTNPPSPNQEFDMSDFATTDDLFFSRSGLDRARTENILEEALDGMDDGELFTMV